MVFFLPSLSAPEAWPRSWARAALRPLAASFLAVAAFLLAGTEPLDAAEPAATAARFFIREFQVQGAHVVSRRDIEATVYPFLGPGRTVDDVERARLALEKIYRDRGFQTVAVEVPEQSGAGGVIRLVIEENPVGRLRVKGARFYSPDRVRREAASVAEGHVANFNDVSRNLVELNQLPGRRVTPSLHAGATPGTVDVDLEVKDSSPLHASLELNNRHSPNTSALRLNGSVSDENLWQRGHTAGFSFQLAPEQLDDAKVFSAYYLARVPTFSGLSLLAQGTKQDSNVSTLGGAAVAGRGEIVGVHAIQTLPAGKDFYHSLNVGLDYKHFDQRIVLGATAGGTITSPITYFPLSGVYNASWVRPGDVSEASVGATLHLRGTGLSSGDEKFGRSRYLADGGFFYLRGELAHTHDFHSGFQLYGKVQGQLADSPLVSSEQYSGGGVGTVRGYLESETIGDSGAFATVELRTPSLARLLGDKTGEWRFYAFGDAGGVTLIDALPGQAARYGLASFGVGSFFRLHEHFSGSVDAAVPLAKQSQTDAHEVRVTFRAGADF